jgi:hypothetical protein
MGKEWKSRQIKNRTFAVSPDGSGILFLAFSARKRYSGQRETMFKERTNYPLLKIKSIVTNSQKLCSYRNIHSTTNPNNDTNLLHLLD